MRPDLLALTPDDLAALTNRGTVKRAQRELDEVAGTLTETTEGDVTAVWADGVTCTIPAAAALADGRCTCPAVGLCRHLLRTVLLYQKQPAASSSSVSPSLLPTAHRPPTPTAPWDPGAIPDDELAKHFRPAVFSRLKGQFNQGVLAEVVRAGKPTVRFYQPAAVVRFLVPGDPRYTHCDCADPAPCPHVPLAVWAFRKLPADVPAGVVATGGKSPAVPADLLDEVEAVVREFAEVGLSGATAAWADRLARLDPRCRAAGLVWPAEVVAELVEQHARYSGHDALFAPDRVPDLVGELLARRDAIAHDTGALPQPLIRGTGNDAAGQVGKCRLIGLGCGVNPGRRGAELVAYLQDADTGAVAVVSKEFADPADATQEPRPFADLARSAAVKSTSFADLGRGQLLADGGRRTAGFRLTTGRAPASVQPQAFAWETLKPPTLVEEYAELAARLAGLPPSALRPRRAAEDFYVLPVAAVEGAGFDVPGQSVVATLRDAAGQTANLIHPFSTRGRAGTEALLAKLHDPAAALKFVSGAVRRAADGLVVHPVCCVFEAGAGRVAVQPWVDAGPVAGAGNEVVAARPAAHPVAEVGRQLHAALADVFTLGLRRADAAAARRWRELHRQAEAVGLARTGAAVGRVADALAQKAHVVRWDAGPAAGAVLELAVLARLARDVGWPGG